MQYPKHLYEPERIDVAKTYFKREFRKYFPSLKGDNIWDALDSDIDAWFNSSAPSGVNGPRDFWDGFFGFATGFKLKNGLLEIITAQNITWTRGELPLNDTLTTGGNLLYIHADLASPRLSTAYLQSFFDEHTELADTWLNIFTEHAQQSAQRDHFPIIVEEQIHEGRTILATHDGNRRLVHAVLSGKKSLPAHIARYSSSPQDPQNFWVSTSFLMQMIVLAKKCPSEDAYQATLLLLKNYATLSEAGAIELKERALWGSSKLVQRLRKDLYGESHVD